MDVSRSIFRSYDIRGTYPEKLNEEISTHIGRGLGTMLVEKGLKKVVVGMDNRKTSPSLKESFISGILLAGCDVTDIGISLTPIIHFLTCTQDFDAGVEVTASHNPAEFNGFRIDYRDAVPFYGDDIKKLYEIVLSEKYSEGRGSRKKKDLFTPYLDYFKSRFSFSQSTNVVVDCGNGTSSFFAERIFSSLGCSVVPLYCDSDSGYPHGTPDPEDRIFLRDLQKKVGEHNADVGFAFDTDADRFGVVGDDGEAYDTDKILMLFSKKVLSDKPGSKILFDIKCSGVLTDLILSYGGEPVMMRTGHPYFVEAIKKGAALGGEFSGHTFFGNEYFGYDDGIYASCKVIEIIEEAGKPLSDLMSEFPKTFHSSEIKVPCSDELKFDLVDTLVENFEDLEGVVEVISLDGVRVRVTDTGWFLIRASNTSPYISVRLEGKTEDEAKLMLKKVKSVLKPFDFLNTSPLDSVEIYSS